MFFSVSTPSGSIKKITRSRFDFFPVWKSLERPRLIFHDGHDDVQAEKLKQMVITMDRSTVTAAIECSSNVDGESGKSKVDMRSFVGFLYGSMHTGKV